jgi:hypothetical protein
MVDGRCGSVLFSRDSRRPRNFPPTSRVHFRSLCFFSPANKVEVFEKGIPNSCVVFSARVVPGASYGSIITAANNARPCRPSKILKNLQNGRKKTKTPRPHVGKKYLVLCVVCIRLNLHRTQSHHIKSALVLQSLTYKLS